MTLRLWARDGSALATLQGHTDAVLGALELADGRILSWGDSTLRLWTRDVNLQTTLHHSTNAVSGILWLADGRLLSWGDKTLRLWTADGSALATLQGHGDLVEGALELADGRILSWSFNYSLRLWAGDGSPLAVIELGKHSKYVDSVLGAWALTDGRLLTWTHGEESWDETFETLWLWASDGTLLSVQTGSDPISINRDYIIGWAAEQGFDGMMLFKDTPPLDTKRVRVQGTQLDVFDPNTGAKLASFFGDANFTSKVVVLDDTMAIGDSVGRVLFLHYVSGSGAG